MGEVDGEILNHYSEDYDLFAMAIIAKNKDGIYSANLKNMLDEFY